MCAVGGDDKFPLAPCLDAMALHQPLDAFLSDPNASGLKFFPHAGPAVFGFDFSMDDSDVSQQGCVGDALTRPWMGRLVRRLAPPVFKVAAGADFQDFAGQRDRPLRFVRSNPGVLHRSFCAKYAVAFFTRSHSIFGRAFSALKRANSIYSALTGLSSAPMN